MGQILSRFENAGLKIVALKIVRPPRAFIEKHYPNTPDWIRGMGEKSLSNYKDLGKDPIASELSSAYGTSDIYGMHWIIDVDNVYGFGRCGDGTTKPFLFSGLKIALPRALFSASRHFPAAWGRTTFSPERSGTHRREENSGGH